MQEIYGEEKVEEAMVAPYLGAIGHVMLLDEHGNPKNIPKDFKDISATEVRNKSRYTIIWQDCIRNSFHSYIVLLFWYKI